MVCTVILRVFFSHFIFTININGLFVSHPSEPQMPVKFMLMYFGRLKLLWNTANGSERYPLKNYDSNERKKIIIMFHKVLML